jgi:3-hydroxyacyl-[acyl-carrier-protein] dehydratase
MKSDIEAILPHRPPFLWVDRILHIEPGARCVASKYIDPSASFFAGHFPGDPILPGIFLVEASAQTAGVMLGSGSRPQGPNKRLAAINHFKFLKPVRPGATVEVETRTLVEQDGMAVASAVITVRGEVVASGELTLVAR